MATIQESAPEKSAPKRIRKSYHLDMASLVDLAFLLLTFFIMTTNFQKHHIMSLDMPHEDGENPPKKADEVMTVYLTGNNQIYWHMGDDPTPQRTTYAGSGIRKIFLEKNAAVRKIFVLIKPTDQSRYQNVIDVLDEIDITDIQRYAIVKLETEDLALLTQHKIVP
jgi:biopolymer transport protein ExbD